MGKLVSGSSVPPHLAPRVSTLHSVNSPCKVWEVLMLWGLAGPGGSEPNPAPRLGYVTSINGRAIAGAMCAFGREKTKLSSPCTWHPCCWDRKAACAGGRCCGHLKATSPWTFTPLLLSFHVMHPTGYDPHSLCWDRNGHCYPLPSAQIPSSSTTSPAAMWNALLHMCQGSATASFSTTFRALCSAKAPSPALSLQPAITLKPKIAAQRCQHHSRLCHAPRPGCGDGRTLLPALPARFLQRGWARTAPRRTKIGSFLVRAAHAAHSPAQQPCREAGGAREGPCPGDAAEGAGG